MVDQQAHGRNDEGSMMIMIIGFVIIVVLLIVVAIDAARLFLAQRDLANAADAASAAASQAVSEQVVYGGKLGSSVPIDPAGAAAAASDYLVLAGAADEFDGLAIANVTTTAVTVTVTLTATVDLPFAGFLPDDLDTYSISASSTATSPFAN